MIPFSSRFMGPLVVEVVPAVTGGKIYRLVDPLDYMTDVLPHPVITIPAGFESDGASVPRVFWPWFPPSGQYTAAAIVHDWLCDTRSETWQDTHAVFAEALEDLRVPRWQRLAMAWAVRVFGPRWAPIQ